MFATGSSSYLRCAQGVFQSLSGVLDVCNQICNMRQVYLLSVSIPFRGFRCLQLCSIIESRPPCRMFQSLSGVLDVCNPLSTCRAVRTISLFQSLSGVLDVCNVIKFVSFRSAFIVSIPFRGFRCLQQEA